MSKLFARSTFADAGCAGPFLFAVVFAGVFAASFAFAQSPEPAPEPIRIEYAAPPQCPGVDEFVQRVRARTARWKLVDEAADARTFAVHIDVDDVAAHGKLTIVEHGGLHRVRTLDVHTCADLVDALALMTALAIDPEAALAAPPPTPSALPLPSTSAPTPAASILRTDDASAPPSAASSVRRWGVSLGAGGEFVRGVAPVSMYGGHVVGGVVSERGLHASLRASVAYARSEDFVVEEASARFSRVLGALEFCPLRAPANSAVGFRPCMGFAMGALTGTGTGVANPRRATSIWLEGSLGAALEWAIGPAFGVSLRGFVAAPLVRPLFEFEPNIYVYRVPSIVGGGTLDAEVHFL